MTGSMNFSMQMTLPFLLTLLQISRAAWISCPQLTDVPVFLWIQRRLKSPVVTHDLPALSFSVHGDTLSNVQEFTYLDDRMIYCGTAVAWTVKSSTVLKLLHLPSADGQNVSFSITTLHLFWNPTWRQPGAAPEIYGWGSKIQGSGYLL